MSGYISTNSGIHHQFRIYYKGGKASQQKKVVIVERLKQEFMYGLSAETNDRCRRVAVVEWWPLLEVRWLM